MPMNNFDVMKRMSEEGKDIRLSSVNNITNLTRTKAGDTLITIGVQGDLVAAIGVHRRYAGGLILMHKEQFDEMKALMEKEEAEKPK